MHKQLKTKGFVFESVEEGSQKAVGAFQAVPAT